MIAEVGSCHDGSITRAIRMIRLAARAGADVCKLQWTSNPARLCERRRAPEYLDAYRLIAFPQAWHAELAAVCADEGVEYACTVYAASDLPVIAPYVKRFKIASFEAGDAAFVTAHRAWGVPLVISTGMMTLAEVRRLAVRPGDILMHCTSAYPTPLDQANLGAIRTLTATWPVAVGYSDHTRCEFTGGLAVAAGARAIEVHFADYGTDPANRDMAVALTPGQLRDYVAFVRWAERAVGSAEKVPAAAEAAMMAYRVGTGGGS